jgi:hypothetical protein
VRGAALGVDVVHPSRLHGKYSQLLAIVFSETNPRSVVSRGKTPKYHELRRGATDERDGSGRAETTFW